MFQTDKKPILFNKELSGGIVTFNSRLKNIPLSKCEITIPVTQTGSGTPSPDNIRDFIPVSGVNIGQTSGYGKYFRGLLNGTYGFVDLGTIERWLYNSQADFMYCPSSLNPAAVSQSMGEPNCILGTSEYTKVDSDKLNTATGKCYTMYGGRPYFVNTGYTDTAAFKTAMSGVYLIYELAEPSTPVTPQEFAMLCQAFGITGNTYQITFGQTVYSAILDVLNGKLYLTHEIKTIDEDSDITMLNEIVVLDNFFDIDNDTESVNCNVYQRGENRSNTSNTMAYNPDYSFCGKNGGYATRVMIKDTRFTSVEDYKTWLSTNPVKVAVKLAEPIEVILEGHTIEAVKGVNNIFANIGTITAKIVEVK